MPDFQGAEFVCFHLRFGFTHLEWIHKQTDRHFKHSTWGYTSGTLMSGKREMLLALSTKLISLDGWAGVLSFSATYPTVLLCNLIMYTALYFCLVHQVPIKQIRINMLNCSIGNIIDKCSSSTIGKVAEKIKSLLWLSSMFYPILLLILDKT